MGPEALRVAGIHAALTQRGLDVRGLRQCQRPAESRPDRGRTATAIWREVDGLEPRGARRGVSGARRADRLPILLGGDHSLEHRLHLRGGAPLPRHAQAAARALARRARRFQYARTEPERQPARHAGVLPVRIRPARARCRSAASTPAIRPQWMRQVGIRSVDAGERRFVHEQELEVFDMRYIDEMGVQEGDGTRACRTWTRTPICTSASTSISWIPEIAPGVGTTVAGRHVLPRSAIVHGNDRRHRAASARSTSWS